jgi:hypothetical protein
MCAALDLSLAGILADVSAQVAALETPRLTVVEDAA